MTDDVYNIYVLPAAKRDVYKIWKELSAINPMAADRLLAKIDERVLGLQEFAERGIPRDELLEGLRMLVEGKNLICYRVLANRVEIVRVIHGSQDLNHLFK